MTPVVPTNSTNQFIRRLAEGAGCDKKGEGAQAAQQNQNPTWLDRQIRGENPVETDPYNAPQCGEPSNNAGEPAKTISSREPGLPHKINVSTATAQDVDELPDINSLSISDANIPKAGSSERSIKLNDNTSEVDTLSCERLAAKVLENTSVKENVSSAKGLANEIWKDAESDNTVVFALNKYRMMNKSFAQREVRSNFRTPAATVLINGEPVTFYMNWGFNEYDGQPFLVARDTRYVSQVTPYEEKLKVFTQIWQRPPSTAEDFEYLASLEVRNGKAATVCDSYQKPRIHDFLLCNHPTRDLTSNINLKPEVSDDSFNWKRDTDWSLSVTDNTGRVLTKLEDIHFQDEADTYLFDGHAMDAWRVDEFIDHIRGVHFPPLPGETSKDAPMEAKKRHAFGAAMLLASHEISEENSSGINCKFLTRYKKAEQACRTFWKDLEKILQESDTPDQLHFKVSISLRTERDPLTETCDVPELVPKNEPEEPTLQDILRNIFRS